MFNARMFIGHNVNGKPTLDNSTIYDAIEMLGATEYTAYDARGRWNGETEDTSVIEFCMIDSAFVEDLQQRIAPALCETLNQDCILIDVQLAFDTRLITAQDASKQTA